MAIVHLTEQWIIPDSSRYQLNQTQLLWAMRSRSDTQVYLTLLCPEQTPNVQDPHLSFTWFGSRSGPLQGFVRRTQCYLAVEWTSSASESQTSKQALLDVSVIKMRYKELTQTRGTY